MAVDEGKMGRLIFQSAKINFIEKQNGKFTTN